MKIGDLVNVVFWGKAISGKILDIYENGVIVVKGTNEVWYDLNPSDKEHWSIEKAGP